MAVAGERHPVSAEAALWLSARGLGGAEVLAQVANDWLDQQSPAGLREWHRALELSAAQRRERRRRRSPSTHQHHSRTSGPGDKASGPRAPKEGTPCPTPTSPSPAT